MATISLRCLEVAKTIHGNSPWELGLPEAASQTWKKGAILTLNANGYVVEAGADPARILGVACADGQNLASNGLKDCLVWIADENTVFVGNLSGSSVTELVDRGRGYGVVKTGNNWHVDKTDLTNRRVVVVDLDPRDNVGDTNGRVHFMFFSQFRAMSYTS